MSTAPLTVVVLGLSLSSAWGNGHATTYRALLKAFAARGHRVLFLERDVPWYAGHRDLAAPHFCALEFYSGLDDLQRWRGAVEAADAVVVGSFVPQGVAVGDLVQRVARGTTAFYDIDTPVTLARLARGDEDYLAARQIPGYDLYLSFTGGPTLARLEAQYGSPAARVLHCSVDPEAYPRLDAPRRWDLSYLGTYSDDRQPTLEALLLEPARQAPQCRFVVAGAQYPGSIAWPPNVERLEHVPPAEHPAFYAASRFTLNVTRQDMVCAGHSPSVRLFEAGACGTPVISDAWDGIGTLFRPGEEILLAEHAGQVLDILLGWPDAARNAVADAFRARVLAGHTAAHRAAELESHLLAARRRAHQPARERAPT